MLPRRPRRMAARWAFAAETLMVGVESQEQEQNTKLDGGEAAGSGQDAVVAGAHAILTSLWEGA